MSDYCIVVADGARARFFTLEPVESPETQGGPNLVECNDLVNPEQKAHTGQLWSDAKSGRNRAGGGGQAHGYDDHRSSHVDEFKRRFARGVAQQAADLVQTSSARTVILVAQKRMLGFLRVELDVLLKNGVSVHAVAKDLSKLASHELHRYLAKERLVPPRKHPAGT
ncbi:MAG: host attachment protein [Acidiferrobacterales bacterium]|nr:host attachment protein [Acidiferrobacterales bacterium]